MRVVLHFGVSFIAPFDIKAATPLEAARQAAAGANPNKPLLTGVTVDNEPLTDTDMAEVQKVLDERMELLRQGVIRAHHVMSLDGGEHFDRSKA